MSIPVAIELLAVEKARKKFVGKDKGYGVQSVGMGRKYSAGKRTKKLSIRLYVSRKYEKTELPKKKNIKVIPKSFNFQHDKVKYRFPTDVIQQPKRVIQAHKVINLTLCAPIATKPVTARNKHDGVISWFFKKGDQWYALTAAHVVGVQAKKGTAVYCYQNQIGTVQETFYSTLSLDIVKIKLTIEGHFENKIFCQNKLKEFKKPRLAEGKDEISKNRSFEVYIPNENRIVPVDIQDIHRSNVKVKVMGKIYKFDLLIQTQLCTSHGDSGTILWDEKSLTPLGLLTGGDEGSYFEDNKHSYFTEFASIL
ncbi:MAG: hypothetical protein P9M14_15720 [Candidatus Alcyoniella australis]|nr:hypothetical protein [Candidatus Alcyoniella australis]